MSYKITIEHITVKTVHKGGDWEVLGDKEVERDPNFNISKDELTTRIETVRGYTPQIEVKEDVTETLLEQTVGELDLTAVIKAINGIK